MVRPAFYFMTFGVVGLVIFWLYDFNSLYGFVFFGLFGLVVAENIRYHSLSSDERRSRIWFVDIDTPLIKFGAASDKFFQRLTNSRFVPRYDESSLFLLSLSVILVFAGYVETPVSFLAIFIKYPKAAVGFGFLAWGLYLSLYHAFSSKKKTESHKSAMAFFGIIINVYTAFALGDYMLKNSAAVSSYLSILSFWHIANAFYFLILLRMEIIGAANISDRDAEWWEVVIGSIAVSGIFFVSRYSLQNYWAVTFSLCVGYASTLNRALGSLFVSLKKSSE